MLPNETEANEMCAELTNSVNALIPEYGKEMVALANTYCNFMDITKALVVRGNSLDLVFPLGECFSQLLAVACSSQNIHVDQVLAVSRVIGGYKKTLAREFIEKNKGETK